MTMMFFYFLKIIFDISTSKRFKKYKPHSILAKKIIKIYKHNDKQTLGLGMERDRKIMFLFLVTKKTCG
jgi:hypothetical protein